MDIAVPLVLPISTWSALTLPSWVTVKGAVDLLLNVLPAKILTSVSADPAPVFAAFLPVKPAKLVPDPAVIVPV